MQIKFEEEPNYNKLKFLLIKCLLDADDVPDKRYDWNKDLIMKQFEGKKKEKFSLEICEQRRNSLNINQKIS